MAKLWNYFDGEPFLDNPHLAVLTNPKQRSKAMAGRKRDAKGRFLKKSRASAHRRTRRRAAPRRAARRRTIKLALTNPRRHTRRRSYRRNPVIRRRRRGYRRNPARFGGIGQMFSKPTLKNVGFAVVGLAGTPMLSGFVSKFLPASLVGNQFGNYALKGASAYGLSLAARKFAGREAGNAVLVGGLAYIAIGLISDFFPSILGIGTTPAAAGAGRYLMKQPLLAAYPKLRGPITAGAPSRLDPANRF